MYGSDGSVTLLDSSVDDKVTPNPDNYTPEPMVVVAVRSWLGQDGLDFFREVKAKHGTVLAVWAEEFAPGRTFPYSVHSNEGRQVRNFLRDVTGNSWSCHDYDNRWAVIVEEAIKE